MVQEKCGGERGRLLSHHLIQLEIADELSSATRACGGGEKNPHLCSLENEV